MKRTLISLYIILSFLIMPFQGVYGATPVDNTALIQKLLAQIAVLQAELNKLRGVTIPACTFTRLLVKGTQGTDVTCLQTYLKSKGHFTGNPTGYYGPVTRHAVATWQRAMGIIAEPWEYGRFGEQSRGVYAKEMNEVKIVETEIDETLPDEDTTPLITRVSPKGIMEYENPVTLRVATDIKATCKYGVTDAPFNSMPYTTLGAGTKIHTATLENIPQEIRQQYYARCMSVSGKESLTKRITFTLEKPNTATTTQATTTIPIVMAPASVPSNTDLCAVTYKKKNYPCSVTKGVVTAGVYRKNLSAYEKTVLPYHSGREIQIGMQGGTTYPAATQWGQFQMFIDEDSNSIVLVHAKDSTPDYGQQWWVSSNSLTLPCVKGQFCLLLTFRDPTPPVVEEVVFEGTTDWRVPATYYKEWVKRQSWYRSHGKLMGQEVGHIITGATVAYSYYDANLSPLVPFFSPKKVGVFMTQYRNDPFDVNYPEYTPKTSVNVPAWLQSIKISGNGIGFPYINGSLWDSTHSGYSVNNMCLDSSGKPHASVKMLKHVDPALANFPQILRDEFNTIVDSDGQTSQGIYIDVATAVQPHTCYHGSVPDDASWIPGVKRVLSAFDDKIIMAESVAEIYLPFIDINYIYSPHTPSEGMIGLFEFIYGDVPGLFTVGHKSDSTPTEQKLIEYQSNARNVLGFDAMLFSNSGMTNDIALKDSLQAKYYYKAWSGEVTVPAPSSTPLNSYTSITETSSSQTKIDILQDLLNQLRTLQDELKKLTR